MPIPRPDPPFFYSAERKNGRKKNWAKKKNGLRWSIFSEKSQLTENQAKRRRKEKPHRVRCSQGQAEEVCKISRPESKKERGHSPANKVMGFNVNQPVSRWERGV